MSRNMSATNCYRIKKHHLSDAGRHRRQMSIIAYNSKQCLKCWYTKLCSEFETTCSLECSSPKFDLFLFKVIHGLMVENHWL